MVECNGVRIAPKKTGEREGRGSPGGLPSPRRVSLATTYVGRRRCRHTRRASAAARHPLRRHCEGTQRIRRVFGKKPSRVGRDGGGRGWRVVVRDAVVVQQCMCSVVFCCFNNTTAAFLFPERPSRRTASRRVPPRRRSSSPLEGSASSVKEPPPLPRADAAAELCTLLSRRRLSSSGLMGRSRCSDLFPAPSPRTAYSCRKVLKILALSSARPSSFRWVHDLCLAPLSSAGPSSVRWKRPITLFMLRR